MKSPSCCTVCQKPDPAGVSLLQCRGCGYAAHPACHRGPKLCPKCTKPLVTAAVAKGFEDGHAKAKRKMEFRLSGLILTGCLVTAAMGGFLALMGQGWHWFRIPFGTLLLLGLVGASAIFAWTFLRTRRSSAAVAALILYMLGAALFVPGANSQLQPDKVSPGRDRVEERATVLILIISFIPFTLAPLAWYEYHRWRSVPGTSAGIDSDGKESIFEASKEAFQEIGEFTAKKMIGKK